MAFQDNHNAKDLDSINPCTFQPELFVDQASPDELKSRNADTKGEFFQEFSAAEGISQGPPTLSVEEFIEYCTQNDKGISGNENIEPNSVKSSKNEEPVKEVTGSSSISCNGKGSSSRSDLDVYGLIYRARSLFIIQWNKILMKLSHFYLNGKNVSLNLQSKLVLALFSIGAILLFYWRRKSLRMLKLKVVSE